MFWHMVLGESFIYKLLPAGSAPQNPVIDFLLTPLVAFIALFIVAGITHAGLAIFGGAKHGFRTTVRVCCFASSAQLFNVVPVVGTFVGTVWAIVVTVIGLREAHATTTGKAVAAIMLPLLLFMALAVFALIATLATGLLPV